MGKGNLRVRASELSDVDSLLTLIQYAFRGGKSSGKSWTGEEHLVKGPRITRAQLIDCINSESGTLLVCDLLHQDNTAETVGCINVEPHGEDEAYVGMLAVDPDKQSLGIGSALMQASESHAIEHMHAKRMVGQVVSARPELMSWYERLGYRATGETYPFEVPDVTPLVEGLMFIKISKELSPETTILQRK